MEDQSMYTLYSDGDSNLTDMQLGELDLSCQINKDNEDYENPDKRISFEDDFHTGDRARISKEILKEDSYKMYLALKDFKKARNLEDGFSNIYFVEEDVLSFNTELTLDQKIDVLEVFEQIDYLFNAISESDRQGENAKQNLHELGRYILMLSGARSQMARYILGHYSLGHSN